MLKVFVLAAAVLAAPLATPAAPFDDAVAASVQGDLARARALFAQGAEAGDARAQFNLGRMYLEGEGGPRDDAQALKWSEKAARQDIPGAQYNLGRLYDLGRGVSRDPRRAAEWYRKAAAKGYASAQVRLGDLYAAGRGAPFDPKRAAELYGAAADQGDAEAKTKLAVLSLKSDLGLAAVTPHGRFAALMDSVFGPGAWRETGGFRTARREDELRAQGALTVPEGARSAHSMGKPQAPGAYDLVVKGLTPEEAAKKLRASKAPLKVIFAEAAHGTEGPHLHVEPYSIAFDTGPRDQPLAADPARIDQAANWLRDAAAQGHPGAQLWMGRLYARQGAPAAERALAHLWFARVVDNPQSDPETRKQAHDALARLKIKRGGKTTELALARACGEGRAACEGAGTGE